MVIEDRMALFSEQMLCGADIYTWHYDSELNPIKSNCPEETRMDELLYAFGGKDVLRDYLTSSSHQPLIISLPIGLLWCATAFFAAEEAPGLYMIGPVRSSSAEISVNRMLSMENSHLTRGADMAWLKAMETAIRSLPIVMPMLMYQYTLMLHYTVNEEHLSLSDIIQQQTHGLSEPEETPVRSRNHVWHAEQAMLNMVRTGDMGYPKAFNHAGTVSKGVPLEGGDHLRQSKISVIVFTSLCTRAAIEGGLSPDQAYTLGDSYIQSVEKCGTISDVASYAYAMYSDFVEHVHSLHIDPNVSSHIRAVCEYVELHADEPFTNQELARRIGYSEQYLRRKFLREMGISLPEYVHKVRIARAKMLLVSGEMSIQEIADQLQFCSRAHFSDVFRKLTGETPAHYRESRVRM